jgi:hypothetical protein
MGKFIPFEKSGKDKEKKSFGGEGSKREEKADARQLKTGGGVKKQSVAKSAPFTPAMKNGGKVKGKC